MAESFESTRNLSGQLKGSIKKTEFRTYFVDCYGREHEIDGSSSYGYNEFKTKSGTTYRWSDYLSSWDIL